MKSMLMISLLISAPLLSHAEDYSYKVKGMHCGGCVKMIKAKVCTMDGVDKCEVEMGAIKFSSKNGIKFTPEQVQEALSKAGEYTLDK